MDFLRQLLPYLKAPRLWTTEAQVRRAEVLTIAHIFIFCGGLLYLIIPPSILNGQPVYVFATLAISVIGSVLLRSGYLKWSGIWTTAAMWLMFTAGSVTEGGIVSSSFAGTLAMVVFAGLAYGVTGAIAISIYSIIAGALLVYAKLHALLPAPAIYYSEVNVLADFTVYIAVTMLFTVTAVRRIERSTSRLEGELAERARTENALRESEERFRSLYDNSVIGLYRTTREGRIILANPTLVDKLGYSSFEELAARNLENEGFEPSYQRSKFVEQIELTGEVTGLESSWTRNDGSTIYVRESARAIRDAAGRTLYYDGTVEDITDRKRAEVALRESQEMSTSAFRRSPVAMQITRLDDGTYVDVNDVFLRDTGFTREQVVGHSTNDLHLFVHPADRALMLEALHAHQGVLHNHEMNFRMKSGRIATCLISINTLTLGGVPHLLSSIVDISDRKRSQDELEASEQKYRLLFLNNPVPMWVCDITTLSFLAVNDFAVEQYGYGRDEFLRMTLRDIRLEEDLHQFQESFNRHDGPMRNVGKSRHRKKDGSLIEVEITTHDIEYDGHLARLVLALETTEKVRAERMLRQSEEKFRTAFLISPDSININRLSDSMYVSINQGFTRVMGYAEGEVVGRTSVELDIWVNPDQRKALHAGLRERGRVENLEAQFRTKSGKVIWGLMSASVIHLEGVPHILSITREITEMRLAEEKKLELERQLLHAQKLESLGVLAGGIAHDFNNLLTAISGNLDLAIRRSPASAARTNIERALQATSRASDLTREMLAYSGKGRFLVSRIDLNDIVQENGDFFRSAISKTSTLTINLTPGLPNIEADPAQLQQVVMNLITNASEAIGENHGIINLSTGVAECDDRVLRQSRIDQKPSPGRFVYVEVKDTGCGMTREVQDRLFDPFFTTKFTGRGLGMAAIQGIIRGHKGAIFIDSEPHLGTTIRALFPVSTAVEIGDTEKAAAPASLPAFKPFSGTILIVDDEEIIRDLASEMVGELGFRCLCAVDGEEAVEIFRHHAAEIACVLLDLTMPRKDGVETLKELRQIRPDISVILSSGYNEQETVQKFPEAEHPAFIQKPYQLQEMRKKLEEVLGS